MYKSIQDKDGRYVIIDAEINGLRLTLCNIYGPNEDNADFYIEVIQHVGSLPNDNRIIGGDFNLVLNILIDKKSGTMNTNKKSQILINSWMEETELVDIWRFQHPDSRKYTGCRSKPSTVFCRLDFFLVSYGITEKIIKSDIQPGYKSDHSLVFLIFKPFLSPRGRGFWKLNCSHLRDLDYTKRIKLAIQNTSETNKKCKSQPSMGCYRNNSQGRIHKIWSSEEKTCWKWSSENWTRNKRPLRKSDRYWWQPKMGSTVCLLRKNEWTS